MESVCNLKEGTSFHAVADGPNCEDWKCVQGNRRLGINMDEHCKNTYGGGAYAKCGSKGINGWRCVHSG